MAGAADRPLERPSSAAAPLELVHHHPGRLRLRAPALIGDATLATRIREAVEGHTGVRKYVHNTRTGSVLIEYEPALADADALVTLVGRASGLGQPLSPREARRRRRSAARVIIDVARELDSIAHETTGWRADLKLLAPMSLAAAAAYSFVRNDASGRLPRWDNLLWWSYSVFKDLHKDEIEDAARESAELASSARDGER